MVSGNVSSRLAYKMKMAEIKAKAKKAQELKRKGIRGQVKYETRTTRRTSGTPSSKYKSTRLQIREKAANENKAKYAALNRSDATGRRTFHKTRIYRSKSQAYRNQTSQQLPEAAAFKPLGGNYGNTQYNSNPALQGTGVVDSRDKKNQWWSSPDFLDNF